MKHRDLGYWHILRVLRETGWRTWVVVFFVVVGPYFGCFICYDNEASGGYSDGPAIQSADLNGDGCVDLRDFARLQNEFTGPIPLWLQDLIDGFEAGGVYYSPGHVWQYRYNGELTYYVPPRCCNVMSVLYDVYGARICHPDGGMNGQGDGRCPDFFDERTDEVLVWEDPRV